MKHFKKSGSGYKCAIHATFFALTIEMSVSHSVYKRAGQVEGDRGEDGEHRDHLSLEGLRRQGGRVGQEAAQLLQLI